MLLGIPADVWDTILGIAAILISAITTLTVIVGASVTVSTYRSDIANKEHARLTERQQGPRSLEAWLEDPFVYVVTRVHDGTTSRQVDQSDSAPEGWRLRTVADRPNTDWYRSTFPDTPEREDFLRQLDDGNQVSQSFLTRDWSPSIRVRNYGDRSLRVARLEYECITYADESGRGLEFEHSNPRTALPLGVEYVPSSSSPMFWTPLQEDGAVSPFPWMIRSATDGALRVDPGAEVILTSLEDKANDLVNIALLESLEGQHAPVVVSLALRAFWIVDQSGTYWESRDGSLRELVNGPDWERNPPPARSP